MTKNKHFRVYLPRIIGGLIFIVAIVYVVKIIGRFIDEQPVKHEKKIQPITILKPPPPPPPPPKVEKPPEPEEVQKKIEELEQAEPEPEPLPDVPDQKPDADTGLDAEGTAGSDAFGLVGRKGGRGLLGGGGGGNPNTWYAGVVKKTVLDVLSDNQDLRRKAYYAIVKIWVNPDGTINRFELAQGSKDPEIDSLLNRQLAKLKSIKEVPPAGMEQPLKLKISSRI